MDESKHLSRGFDRDVHEVCPDPNCSRVSCIVVDCELGITVDVFATYKRIMVGHSFTLGSSCFLDSTVEFTVDSTIALPNSPIKLHHVTISVI